MATSPRLYKALLGLGITQIILGVLCMVMIGALWGEKYALEEGGFVLVTIVGVFFITTGGFSIAASKWKKTWLILPLMILAIISAVLAGVLIIQYSVGIHKDLGRRDYSYGPYRVYKPPSGGCIWSWNRHNGGGYYSDYDWRYPTTPFTTTTPPPTTTLPLCDDFYIMEETRYYVVMTMYGLSIVCCIAELVIAVVTSAFSCKDLCNRCRECRGKNKESSTEMQVGYVLQIPTENGTYQPPMIIPTDATGRAPKLKKVLIPKPDPGTTPGQQSDVISCSSSLQPEIPTLSTDGETKGDRTLLVGKVNIV